MSISTPSEPHLPTRASQPTYRRRSMPTQCLPTTPHSTTLSDAEEATFWAHFEEREHGRLAQEADHLFDTNHSWAA